MRKSTSSKTTLWSTRKRYKPFKKTAIKIGKPSTQNMNKDSKTKRNSPLKYHFLNIKGHQIALSTIRQLNQVRLNPKLSQLNLQNHQTLPTSKLKPQL